MVCVDIQSGLINKVAVTPANVTDAKGFTHVLPTSGAVYAIKVAAGRGIHLWVIKKNNMEEKNFIFQRSYYTIPISSFNSPVISPFHTSLALGVFRR